jgi:hypothetical protein
MNENFNSTGAHDPFSQAEAPGISLVVLLRIYDVLMGMYTEMAPEKADALIEAHLKGTLLGPTPAFSGQFLTNEVSIANSDENQ